jgi:hypothetical protein
MSYCTWHTYGFGVCVDDIKTTPERLLNLAALKPEILKKVNDYIAEFADKITEEDPLVIEDFYELYGDYGENGVAYVLHNVIDEIPVEYADDYDGIGYILYTPTYPWGRDVKEHDLKEEDVVAIFSKYISILTDDPVTIDYYSVENGG